MWGKGDAQTGAIALSRYGTKSENAEVERRRCWGDSWITVVLVLLIWLDNSTKAKAEKEEEGSKRHKR
ncbi:MAG: hypothetical protein ACLR23_08335 [Clostridia bacterium]